VSSSSNTLTAVLARRRQRGVRTGSCGRAGGEGDAGTFATGRFVSPDLMEPAGEGSEVSSERSSTSKRRAVCVLAFYCSSVRQRPHSRFSRQPVV